MFSSRARNRSRSSPPVGSFGRIGGSSSRAPPIESPRPAAAKHKPHLQAFRPQDDSSLQNTILLGAIRPLRHSPFRLLHGRLAWEIGSDGRCVLATAVLLIQEHGAAAAQAAEKEAENYLANNDVAGARAWNCVFWTVREI